MTFLKTVSLIAITLLTISFLSPAAEAGFSIDPVLTEEYYSNPDNFFSGSGIGTGAIRRYKKDIFNVEEYNPPYYVISIDVVYLFYRKNADKFMAEGSARERFYYNLEAKKAYREMINHDKGGQLEWEEIKTNFRNEKGIANDIFKLAYNMDFFSPSELK